MIRHTFNKNNVDEERITKIAFENVKVGDPDRLESPIVTACRILGEKFYLLNEMDSLDDAITLHMEPNGVFNTEKLNATIESSKDFLNYLDLVFNGYSAIAGNAQITKEGAEKLVSKIAITKLADDNTPGGVIIQEVPLSRFNRILMYKPTKTIDGNTVDIFSGVLKQEEIIQLAQNIQKNNAAINKIGENEENAKEMYEKLMKETTECQQKIRDIYKEVIDGFFEVIRDITKSADIEKDVIDIAFQFSIELKVSENETRRFTDLIMIHNKDLSMIQTIRGKFGLQL